MSCTVVCPVFFIDKWMCEWVGVVDGGERRGKERGEKAKPCLAPILCSVGASSYLGGKRDAIAHLDVRVQVVLNPYSSGGLRDV